MNTKNPENSSEEECGMAEQRASGTTEHQMTRAGSDELEEAQAQRAGIGSVHMTQDTCGKQVLPTSPSACT